jgi:aspartate/methionine/tyrosine aminotransferase
MTVRPSRRVESLERTLIRQIFDSAPKDAINLGLGQPDLPTPDVIARAGVAGIEEGRTGYTTTAGDIDLRRAIAGEYPGFAAGPESVVVHVGTQEAMFAAALALLDPGDELLIPDPGYPAYAEVAGLVGAEAVRYPLRAERAFRLDPADVESRIGERTRAVLLCSPSNPTGAVNRDEDLAALAALLEGRGIAWISDEIYAGFHYDGEVPSLARHSRGGLVISGLSKTLSMTGWRIGWSVGPQELVRRMTAVHQYMVTCAPSVSQRAAVAAFTPEGRAEAERYRTLFARRRERMAAELARIPGLDVPKPDGAFYFYVDVRSRGSSLEIARTLLDREGVVVIPGEAFGPAGAGYLRLSFAAGDADIVRGVAALGKVLAAAG